MKPDVTSAELRVAAKEALSLALLTFSDNFRERLLEMVEELLTDADVIDFTPNID